MGEKDAICAIRITYFASSQLELSSLYTTLSSRRRGLPIITLRAVRALTPKARTACPFVLVPTRRAHRYTQACSRPDVGRNKPAQRQPGWLYSGLLRDVYKDEARAWELALAKLFNLMAVARGAWKQKNQSYTFSFHDEQRSAFRRRLYLKKA